MSWSSTNGCLELKRVLSLTGSYWKLHARVRRAKVWGASLLVVASVAACSGRPASLPEGEPWDPYEGVNRGVHALNKGFDRVAFRPASRVYSGLMGDEIETAISRASNNISLPGDVVNNILQGNMKGATEDTYRFIVNSTIGLFGLFDPATEFNMPPATEADFGQTLYVWGVREGGYVELPFFGPSTERDAVGTVVDFFLNPLDYAFINGNEPVEYTIIGAKTSDLLTQRARFGSTIDDVLYESADSYSQLRSFYLQNRRFELGDAGSDDYLDPYDDPYLADLE